MPAELDRYFVIPLSIQEEQGVYLVGSSELGEFYHFPQEGVDILAMLSAGADGAEVKARLAAENADPVDVDGFIEQLSAIGFIHPIEQAAAVREQLLKPQDGRRLFDVDPAIARAVFSAPVMACGLLAVLYAAASAIADPRLRLNPDAFYTDTNRTALLVVVLGFSLVQVALHETGHMMAAARHGVKSRYGFGNRLWTLVAESDLTGILSLPRSQRYFPMLAGLLVDVLSVALLTILLQALLWRNAGPFAVQVAQSLVLEVVIGMTWQLNIFVKTDLYFVLCNYFSHPDLDQDARVYLNDLIHRASFGRFGSRATRPTISGPWVLRSFAAIWLAGRVLSLFVLLTVFLPTMARYVASAVDLLRASPAPVWQALDTLVYVLITTTMLSVGLVMWLRQRRFPTHKTEATHG